MLNYQRVPQGFFHREKWTWWFTMKSFGHPIFWTNQKLDEFDNFDGGVSDILLIFLWVSKIDHRKFRGLSLLRASMPSMDVWTSTFVLQRVSGWGGDFAKQGWRMGSKSLASQILSGSCPIANGVDIFLRHHPRRPCGALHWPLASTSPVQPIGSPTQKCLSGKISNGVPWNTIW